MLAACAALSRSSAALASADRLTGAFALAGAPQKAEGVLSVAREGPLAARLVFSEAAGGTTLRAYDLEMTQRLHLVVIGANFATFQHLHPVFDGRGHFTVDLHVPARGTYDIYADSQPHGLGHQVFRFAVPFGARTATRPQLALAPTGAHVVTGPYEVALDSLRLRAGVPTIVRVAIREDGRPATDLRPYLGGAAHAVFIDASTLAYLHVHPMASGARAMDAMAGMDGDGDMPAAAAQTHGPVSPNLTFHVVAPRRGTYKLWLQFHGRDGLHVAPFVLRAT